MENVKFADVISCLEENAFTEKGIVPFPLRFKSSDKDNNNNGGELSTYFLSENIAEILSKYINKQTMTASDNIEDKQSKCFVDVHKQGRFPFDLNIIRDTLLGKLNKCRIGKGVFGEVRLVSFDSIFSFDQLYHWENRECALKIVPLFDEDDWKSMRKMSACKYNKSLDSAMDPRFNDTIAEPICSHIISKYSWCPDVFGEVFGTWVENPANRLKYNDTPPSLRIWSKAYESDVKWTCNTPEPTLEQLLELESIVAQVILGVLSMDDLNITHNDLHLSNLMYSGNCFNNSIDCCIPSSDSPPIDVKIPVYNGTKVHIIDFGLASIQIIQDDVRRDVGGNIIGDIGLNAFGTLNTDAITFAMTIFQEAPKFIKKLVKLDSCCPFPQANAQRAWGFLKSFFVKTLHDTNIISLFCKTKKLKEVAASMQVKVRDTNKNLYTILGKYHLIREIMFKPGATPMLHRQDLERIMQTSYGK